MFYSGKNDVIWVVELDDVLEGRHKIVVKYADVDITGSPFHADVFDPNQVQVIDLPKNALLGQQASFQGNFPHWLRSIQPWNSV